jgi:hypothetical protein
VAEPVAAGRGWRRSFLLRRVLPLLIVGGIAVVYFRDAPRDLTLVYHLGARRASLVALRVDVRQLPEGVLARHSEFVFSVQSPAPDKVRHTIRLSPGEYQADLSLDYGTRTDRSERRFTLERQDEIDIAP